MGTATKAQGPDVPPGARARGDTAGEPDPRPGPHEACGGDRSLVPQARPPRPLCSPLRPHSSPEVQPPRRLSAGLCHGSRPARRFPGFTQSQRGQPPCTGARQHQERQGRAKAAKGGPRSHSPGCPYLESCLRLGRSRLPAAAERSSPWRLPALAGR